MNPYLVVALLVVPFVGIVLLTRLLRRWGDKNDPMGGSAKDLWSTTGTQRKTDTEDK